VRAGESAAEHRKPDKRGTKKGKLDSLKEQIKAQLIMCEPAPPDALE
jgi:hypothetical protein